MSNEVLPKEYEQNIQAFKLLQLSCNNILSTFAGATGLAVAVIWDNKTESEPPPGFLMLRQNEKLTTTLLVSCLSQLFKLQRQACNMLMTITATPEPDVRDDKIDALEEMIRAQAEQIRCLQAEGNHGTPQTS